MKKANRKPAVPASKKRQGRSKDLTAKKNVRGGFNFSRKAGGTLQDFH